MIKNKELVLKQDKFIMFLIAQKTESLRDQHFRQGQLYFLACIICMWAAKAGKNCRELER